MKTALSFQKILWIFFAFIAMMILARCIYAGKYGYMFLIWNLFLAWVPFTISTLFKKMNSAGKWKQVMIFCAWLLFFPNALYIVTDLIHLDAESNVPKWFDAVLLFSCSIAGLLMAFVSILRLEIFLSDKFKSIKVQAIILFIFFISSFGVYLGRFLRWNSWDILSNPFALLYSIAQRFIFPFQHLQTWTVTCTLTALFYLLFLAIKKLPGYLNQAIQ
ncbi:MAG: DUF1361 domain-containing protein [Ferruginibacter sp.]